MPLSGEYAPGARILSREHVDKIESSGGADGGDLYGFPVVLLTSVGARTGKLRKTPLMRVEQDGVYAVVGSLGGASGSPGWVHNLRQEPHVELRDGAVTHDYLAREVSGDERAIWWERALAAFPNYAAAQRKTTRVIPVFVLTRLPATTEEA